MLPATAWWCAARAQFMPPPEAQALPASLLARFGVATSATALVATLEFLSPCSLTSFPTRALQRT